jgi:hypothetical protein
MEALFNHKLSPITQSMAFLRGDLNKIVHEFIAWQTELVAANNNVLVKKKLSSDLFSMFMALCPLTSGECRRYLFVPTKGEWVLFLDNGHLGTDRSAPYVLGELLSVDLVYATHEPISETTMFEYCGVRDGGFDTIRAISVSKEGKWGFEQYGNPLPFEQLGRYKERQIKKRFDLPLLAGYLKHLGIEAFDEKFYQTNAVLVEKSGPLYEQTREFSIEQIIEWTLASR